MQHLVATDGGSDSIQFLGLASELAQVPLVQLLARDVCAGDRRALAKAITLVESTKPTHQDQAAELLSIVMPKTGGALRVGISGAPGVGKSTLIEGLGNELTQKGLKTAVLAVDPTSTLSGGSILGDKTRMPSLAVNPDAFVRPSPAGSTLGGVTRRTRETLLLCEAAGYEVVLIETVGVGQSETAVAGMTDLFVLLLSPGGGDDLQGIKRGIMELADLVLVNKADGNQKGLAHQTVADYRSALQFMRSRTQQFTPKVLACSALQGEGISQVWDCLTEFKAQLQSSGEFEANRSQQAKTWMWAETAEILMDALRRHPKVQSQVGSLESAVLAGKLPATVAAKRLAQMYQEAPHDDEAP